MTGQQTIEKLLRNRNVLLTPFVLNDRSCQDRNKDQEQILHGGGRDGNGDKSPAPVTWSAGGNGAFTPEGFVYGIKGHHLGIRVLSERDVELFGRL